MIYGVIFSWLILMPSFLQAEASSGVKEIKKHSIINVTSKQNKLIFDWGKDVHAAFVKINGSWWFVFDQSAKEYNLPRDRDLPTGIINLKPLFDLPSTDDVTLFKIAVHDAYEVTVTKEDNKWILESNDILQKNGHLDIEDKHGYKRDQEIQKTSPEKEIQLKLRGWPSVAFTNIDEYKIINIDAPKINVIYSFILTNNDNSGVHSPYETPYYLINQSKYGVGIQRYTQNVLLLSHNNILLLQNHFAPRGISEHMSSTTILPGGQASILKSIPDKKIKEQLDYLKNTQLGATAEKFNNLERAWLELLFGDEHAAISFLNLAAQYYTGINHHPFFRGLMGVSLVLDRSFFEAKEVLRFLPNTAEVSLFNGIALSAIGLPRGQIKALRKSLILYKNYTKNFREEFLIQVMLALLNAADYHTVTSLISLMPPSENHIFKAFHKYAASIAKSNIHSSPFSAFELSQLLDENEITNTQLRAYINFNITFLNLKNKKITVEEALKKLINVEHMWRGDYFEFMLLNQIVDLFMSNEQYKESLKYLNKIKENFPENFKILHLDKKMEISLLSFFKKKQHLKVSPLNVIATFDEFKEFSPDSEEGSKIIKIVGDLLINLDLLDQAAELLSKESMSENSSPILTELYIKIAYIHIDNKNAEAALSILKKIPYQQKEKFKQEILNATAGAYACGGEINKALDLLESKGSIEGLKEATNLLIRNKLWKEAKDRLFTLVIKLDREEVSELKMNSLIRLAMVNVLIGANNDNQVLKVTYDDFVKKQKKAKQRVFNYLTDDTDFSGITRNVIDEQLDSIKNFKFLFDTILKNKFQLQ